MTAVVDDVCGLIQKRHMKYTPSLQGVKNAFKTVSAVFNMCLRGFIHLCRDIPGRRSKGQAIYALVRFFTGGLDHVHKLCLQKSSLRSENQTSYQIRGASIDVETNINIINSIITELSKLLASFFTAPEFQKSHVYFLEVLEGLIATLLDRIGGLVSQAVFKDNLASLKSPGGIRSPDSSSTIVTLSEIDEKVINFEGKVLTLVLNVAVNGHHNKKAHKTARMVSGETVSKMKSGEGILLEKAKKRLQATFLRGIFGEEGDDFKEAFSIPEPLPEVMDYEVEAEREAHTDNFVEVLWSVVGWETLWG
jgi:hypothetical protein